MQIKTPNISKTQENQSSGRSPSHLAKMSIKQDEIMKEYNINIYNNKIESDHID